MAKKERVVLATPVGRLSFPMLTKKDEGRKYSDGKFKTDLLIPKDVWKKEGKPLMEAVLKVAAAHFGKAVKLKDFKHPFKDCDENPKALAYMKGHIMIRAKSSSAPLIVGPDRKPITGEALAALKGGDYARLSVSVYAYEQQGGGVTLGLEAVQFRNAGEAFGQGKEASLSVLDEMEVPLDEAFAEGAETKEEADDSLSFA